MRIRAITLRILRQFIHDKRTMALMFIAPLVVLSLMSLVFNGDAYEPKIGVSGVPLNISAALKEENTTIKEYASEELGKSALVEGKIDALITLDGNVGNSGVIPQVLLEGSNPTANKAVIMTLQKLSQKLLPSTEEQLQLQPQISYLYGSENMKTIDRFGPIMIGVFVFFFVFLIAGVSFLRERTTGTLERLLSTPLKDGRLYSGMYVVSEFLPYSKRY